MIQEEFFSFYHPEDSSYQVHVIFFTLPFPITLHILLQLRKLGLSRHTNFGGVPTLVPSGSGLHSSTAGDATAGPFFPWTQLAYRILLLIDVLVRTIFSDGVAGCSFSQFFMTSVLTLFVFVTSLFVFDASATGGRAGRPIRPRLKRRKKETVVIWMDLLNLPPFRRYWLHLLFRRRRWCRKLFRTTSDDSGRAWRMVSFGFPLCRKMVIQDHFDCFVVFF